MSEQESPTKDNTANPHVEILEQGDIYFFYRPKKAVEEVKGIEDVRRFFMITAPEENSNNKSPLYRLFVIGKKSLPEVRKTEARASERYWAELVAYLKMPLRLQKNFHQMNIGEEMLQDQLEKESMQ